MRKQNETKQHERENREVREGEERRVNVSRPNQRKKGLYRSRRKKRIGMKMHKKNSKAKKNTQVTRKADTENTKEAEEIQCTDIPKQANKKLVTLTRTIKKQRERH